MKCQTTFGVSKSSETQVTVYTLSSNGSEPCVPIQLEVADIPRIVATLQSVAAASKGTAAQLQLVLPSTGGSR